MKALVFGSLNIDYVYQVPHFVEKGETLASGSFHRFCGGKGLNQSIALSRAGMKTYMAGAIGPEGDFLLKALQDSGVDTGFVEMTEVPTGHAIIQNSLDGDNAILLFGGANRSISEKQAKVVLSAFDQGDLLLVQNEISSLPAILRIARDKGLRIALNPSPMELPLMRELLEFSEFLILNRVEASQLMQEDNSDPDNVLDSLCRLWPEKKIVLTLGGEGAIYADGTLRFRQSAFPVKAVDTTGAGDTFTGFFLAAFFQSGDPLLSLRTAAASAAIAVTRQGAAPAIPDWKETQDFLARQSS